jgi:hypothetical protein
MSTTSSPIATLASSETSTFVTLYTTSASHKQSAETREGAQDASHVPVSGAEVSFGGDMLFEGEEFPINPTTSDQLQVSFGGDIEIRFSIDWNSFLAKVFPDKAPIIGALRLKFRLVNDPMRMQFFLLDVDDETTGQYSETQDESKWKFIGWIEHNEWSNGLEHEWVKGCTPELLRKSDWGL